MTADDTEPKAQQPRDYEPFAHEPAEWIDSGGMETLEDKDLQLLQEQEA